VGDRPLTLNTAVERIGSTSTVTSLRADQEGDLVLIGMGTFGAAGPGPRHAGLAPPAVPRPEACPLLPPGPMPFFQHLDVRSATDARCLGGGDRAELTAWVRFTDGRAISTAGVTMLLDGLGPGLYAMLKAPISMPLMQFSVEFAADLLGESLDGWVLVRTRTDHAGGSWATDDSTAWSEDGRLLAHSRHSRRLILAPS
jgi:acyl-CoA thioesterase